VLNAYGDAMTSVRDEAARTFIRTFTDLTDQEMRAVLEQMASAAQATLLGQGIPAEEQTVSYVMDLRYHGQGNELSIPVALESFDGSGAGLAALRAAFDAEHERLFSFSLTTEPEVVNVRATATGPRPHITSTVLEEGGEDPSAARRLTTRIWVGGEQVDADVYDRARLLAGNVVRGPAIVTEMDSTTLVLPGHAAAVHPSGSLLIRPLED
jgi:N-methylhydantoinase A